MKAVDELSLDIADGEFMVAPEVPPPVFLGTSRGGGLATNRPTCGGIVARPLDLDELVDHFTLDSDELFNVLAGATVLVTSALSLMLLAVTSPVAEPLTTAGGRPSVAATPRRRDRPARG